MRELKKLFKKQIATAMRTDVVPLTKELQSENVQTEVYDAYSPSTPDGEPFVHERRKENGGLASQKNMRHRVKEQGDGEVS